jgi:hypothetical protein
MRLNEISSRPETNHLEVIPELIRKALPEPYSSHIDLSERSVIQFLVDFKKGNLSTALEKLIYSNIKDVDAADKCYDLAFAALQPRFSPYTKG